jgi:hypothetical protein
MSTPANVASPFTEPTSRATEFQMLQFLIAQRLRKVQTAILVEIVAVHGGGLDPVGTVDVLVMVDQVDGAGNSVPHVTLYGRPYVRMQGGSNAIILDPVAGDIGLMVFGSRDLSAVIASKKHGPPPSGRLFGYADGLYVGGMLGAAPTSYLQWKADGSIVVDSPTEVDITAPVIKLIGGGKVLQIDSSGITLDGILWETHTHSGVTSGTDDTGPPV